MTVTWAPPATPASDETPFPADPTQKIPRLPEQLLFVAVVCVPFQQAFTLSLGFPLKISEICSILAIAGLVTAGRAPRFRAVGWGFFVTLFATVLVSTLWHLFTPPRETVFPGYTGGLTFDIILYAGYSILVLVVGWFCATRLGPHHVARAVGIAMRLTALYCIVQLVLTEFHTEGVLGVINGTTQEGRSFGVLLSRNGPFLEGNYLGFFAGVALFLCSRRRDVVGIVAACFCLVYSQSTVAILGTLAALLAMLLLRANGRVVVLLGFLGALVATVIVLVPSATEYVNLQLGKLGFGDAAIADASVNFSIRERSVNTNAGINMAIDNAVVGVGPGRYGFAYNDYFDPSILATGHNDRIIRPIANNTYIQLFAEQGVLAGGALILLLALVILHLVRRRRTDFALVVFVSVSLTASPAWTALPIWITLGYLCAVAALPIEKRAPRSDVDASPFARATPNTADGADTADTAGAGDISLTPGDPLPPLPPNVSPTP